MHVYGLCERDRDRDTERRQETVKETDRVHSYGNKDNMVKMLMKLRLIHRFSVMYSKSTMQASFIFSVKLVLIDLERDRYNNRNTI